MPSLKVVGERGAAFSIYKRITSLGSSPENDIRLVGKGSIAPTHALLSFDGVAFSLQTTERSLTLNVNGKPRRAHKLAHGDRFEIGGVELEFRVLEEPASPGPAGETLAHTELAAYRKLQEFSERLAQRSEPSALFEALLDAVIELSGAQKGFLLLVEDGEPRVRVARDVRRENLDHAIAHLSDSIVAKVVRERRPVIVSDALSDAEFAGSASVVSLRLSSVMCVPLLDKGTLLGLIYVGNDRVKDLFDQRALDVLTVFAGQASLLLANALLVSALRTDKHSLEVRLSEARFGDLVGSCDSMREVFRKVDRVATADVSVLITGETGTGKELVAHELHRRSDRSAGPFVTLNCGAIPENLLESELFGHVRGAFTGATHTRAGKFQAAHRGTLFLDEIGEMPLNLQVKILRALEERVVTRVGDVRAEPVDLRIIAATHRVLEESIREGRFREDLYYRLNVVRLHLPPLRERGDDVVVIAKYLLARINDAPGARAVSLSAASLAALRRHTWPGNVRELENRLKRASVLSERTQLEPEDLELHAPPSPEVLPLQDAKEAFQRRYIIEVLERNGGNRTKAARELGVDPRTVFRFLEKEQP